MIFVNFFVCHDFDWRLWIGHLQNCYFQLTLVVAAAVVVAAAAAVVVVDGGILWVWTLRIAVALNVWIFALNELLNSTYNLSCFSLLLPVVNLPVEVSQNY